jgi:hypothetical protein
MSAPAPALNPMTAEPPAPSPRATVHKPRTRKPARKLYAVIDRRGVVVATSTKPVAQETAEAHASALLEWLSEQSGFAGRAVLYEVVSQLYVEAFCPTLGLKPLPWRVVAKELDALPGVERYKQHIEVDGRRRVKRLIYQLPGARADVVEIDAVRRCA